MANEKELAEVIQVGGKTFRVCRWVDDLAPEKAVIVDQYAKGVALFSILSAIFDKPEADMQTPYREMLEVVFGNDCKGKKQDVLYVKD